MVTRMYQEQKFGPPTKNTRGPNFLLGLPGWKMRGGWPGVAEKKTEKWKSRGVVGPLLDALAQLVHGKTIFPVG